MKEIEAVLFDMDGVIFDTERIYLEIWTNIFNKYGYKMTKDVYVTVMGRGRENVIKTFVDIYGDNLPIMKMYDEKDELLLQIIDSGEVPIKPGAIEILKSLKKNGYKVALATSAKRNRLDKQLKIGNIKNIFDAIVCGDDVTKSKPNPEIFLDAAKKLSVSPKKCIVIEDSPAGIRAAYNANMVGLHVEDLKKSDEEIKKYCNRSFGNLFEIKEYLKI
ncbi:HAD family hydrolase [Clostridium weizhouense]|uniref:HAD family phosphatase n=1 Tax=Clostridium weizhouense TaxID=2859781 RepID=A0ABS7ALH7_9CLOT|nr:HAD family phosphatase [Clostridium weizhouense]MBW6409482.1 HAD family phosphatase [Clostridium weizhouense]